MPGAIYSAVRGLPAAGPHSQHGRSHRPSFLLSTTKLAAFQANCPIHDHACRSTALHLHECRFQRHGLAVWMQTPSPRSMWLAITWRFEEASASQTCTTMQAQTSTPQAQTSTPQAQTSTPGSPSSVTGGAPIAPSASPPAPPALVLPAPPAPSPPPAPSLLPALRDA